MAPAPHDLRQLLAEVPLFSGLSGSDVGALAERFVPVELAAGELLIRQGEPGEFMCLLATGELVVSVDGAAVDRLQPGAVVGEMALLTTPERSATVSAGPSGALVWRLDRADFEHLAAGHPALLEAVHDVARPRLERAQLAPLLADRFGATNGAEVSQWHALARWRRLGRGEVLYRAGDPATEVFLVVSGRLEVRDGSGQRSRVAGRGAVVGESAVVGAGTRQHEVVASRESDVVAFPAAVAGASARFMSRLAADLVAGAAQGGVAGTVGAHVAFLPAGDGAPVAEVAGAVAQRLRAWGPTLVLSSRTVDERFGREGVSQAGTSDNIAPALAMWLDAQLRAHEHVVLMADPGPTQWTARCLRLADTAVLVAPASAPVPPERRLSAAAADLPVDLVLVHPDGTKRPRGTAPWLEALRPRAHHHVRLGEPRDLDRLARRLAGRAIGLALSGGGARGYTHIGLLKALEERGVPVDVVYGTSMGAVIGAGYSVSVDVPEVYRLAAMFGDRKRLMDKTLPLVALTRSRKVNETLRSLYGEDTTIEDLWVPFTCVSASLTHAELRVHDRGPVWRAVRASAAIPGVFTPVLAEGGSDVLVDGGVINSLPVDLLRSFLGQGVVIASNAYGGKAPEEERLSFGDDVSGWAVLRSKVVPFGRRVKAPSLLSTLMRATSLASKSVLDDASRYADLVVTYPSSTVRSLEFDHYEETIAAGYRHAVEAIAAWLEKPGAATWLPAVD